MLIYNDQLDISVMIMAMRAHNKKNIIKNNLWLFANTFKLTAPPCGMIISIVIPSDQRASKIETNPICFESISCPGMC